jgi:hypothetical protein
VYGDELARGIVVAGKETDNWSPTAERESPDFSTAGTTNMPQDPESLIIAMERVTVLFDRYAATCTTGSLTATVPPNFTLNTSE